MMNLVKTVGNVDRKNRTAGLTHGSSSNRNYLIAETPFTIQDSNIGCDSINSVKVKKKEDLISTIMVIS